MRRFIGVAAACLFAFIAVLGMGGVDKDARGELAGTVKVTRISPDDIVQELKPIVLKFSEPMVAEKEIGKELAVENSPVIISPTLEGSGSWLDANTFSFEPFKPYSPATRYDVELRPDVRDLQGRPVVWDFSFATPALALKECRVIEVDKKDMVVLKVEFNLSVAPEQFKQYLTITRQSSGAVLDYGVRETSPSKVLIVEIPMPEKDIVVFSLKAGLCSISGPLGLEKDWVANVDPDSDNVFSEQGSNAELEMRNTYVDVWSKSPRIYIYTNRSIVRDNLEKFVEVTPSVKFDIDQSYSYAVVLKGDFEYGKSYVVKVKKGLPASDGGTLQKDWVQPISIPDAPGKVSLPENSTNYYLSPENGGRIGIDIINIKEVDVKLWRLYENNIVPALGNLEEINAYSYPLHLSRRLFSETIKIDAVKNQKLHKALDVLGMAGQERGVFLVTAQGKAMRSEFADQDDYYDYGRYSQQVVVLTDLGISARVYDKGISVWVNSIASAEPLNGVKIQVYSLSNQLVAEGVTNKDGIMQIVRQAPWEDQLAPGVIIAKTDKDLSFARLNQDLFADSSFDIGGVPYLSGGYEGFLYTPRGVFRPGERVDFKALVRGPNRNLVAPFPVAWRVLSSSGSIVDEGSCQLTKEGGAVFSIDLSATARTGQYSAMIMVPGQDDSVIGRTTFNVEEILPPRIEVKLKVDNKRLLPEESAEFELQSDYLFGAPGANLNWELDVRLTGKEVKMPDWPGYSFGNPEVFVEPIKKNIVELGKLDAKGQAKFSYKPDFEFKASGPMEFTFIARVQEDGGRWVNQVANVPYFPGKFVLGMEQPRDGETFTFDTSKDVMLRVAAVTPEGKPAQVKGLSAKVQKVICHYNWVRDYNEDTGDYVSKWERSEEYLDFTTVPVTVSGGIGQVKFKPGNSYWTTYRVTVSDAKNTVSTSTRIDVIDEDWKEVGAGSGIINRLIMKLDKSSYKVGETAKLTVRSPFLGTMLLGLETDHEIWNRVVTVDKSEATFDIPISADIEPNAYITAVLVRPVVEETEWSPHRAIGVVPVKIDLESELLSVEINAPKRALPESKVPVSVTIKDSSGNPVQGEFSLALVDDGILGLTNYVTPDPFSFFLAKRKLASKDYDIYDELLPPEARATELLRPGGDEARESLYLSTITRQQELLSIFKPTIITDANGQGQVVLDLPEYNGRGRLMIVAASGSRFGKGEEGMVIARDVVVDVSAPRAVAPGDEFIIPVKIFKTAFGNEEAPKDGKGRVATVSIKSEGPVKIKGDNSFTLKLDDSSVDSASLAVSAQAADSVGEAKIIVDTVVAHDTGNTFNQNVSMVVRSSNPRVTLSGSGSLGSGSDKIKMDLPGGTAGSVETSFSVGGMPDVSLLPIASFLRFYPYGCLEQTLSAAWPGLLMPALMREAGASDQDMENTKENPQLKKSITKLGSMQLWDGSFASWPGHTTTNVWGSLYATHFLVEASKTEAIPKIMLGPALEWTRNYLPILPDESESFGPKASYTAKAYACYILALNGQPPLAWMQHLEENRSKMYPSGQILLAGARALAAGNAQPLRSLKITAAEDSRADSPTLESQVRNNAFLLLAWAQVEPNASEAAVLAKTLQEQAAKGLGTTQENGLVLLALGRYLERTSGDRGDFTATVELDGKTLGKATQEKPLQLNDFIAADQGKDTTKTVVVDVDGSGPVFYAWTASGVPVNTPKPYSNGLVIERKWANMAGENIKLPTSGDMSLVPKLKLGERVYVTLTITSTQPVNDVIIVDVLAGGLEVENPRLVGGDTSLEPSKPLPEPEDEYDSDYYEAVREEREKKRTEREAVHLDVRDDRIALIINRLEGSVTYSYSLRAVSKGSFILPPVAGEGMYAPNINALTSGGRVEIE